MDSEVFGLKTVPSNNSPGSTPVFKVPTVTQTHDLNGFSTCSIFWLAGILTGPSVSWSRQVRGRLTTSPDDWTAGESSRLITALNIKFVNYSPAARLRLSRRIGAAVRRKRSKWMADESVWGARGHAVNVKWLGQHKCHNLRNASSVTYCSCWRYLCQCTVSGWQNSPSLYPLLLHRQQALRVLSLVFVVYIMLEIVMLLLLCIIFYVGPKLTDNHHLIFFWQLKCS